MEASRKQPLEAHAGLKEPASETSTTTRLGIREARSN